MSSPAEPPSSTSLKLWSQGPPGGPALNHKKIVFPHDSVVLNFSILAAEDEDGKKEKKIK